MNALPYRTSSGSWLDSDSGSGSFSDCDSCESEKGLLLTFALCSGFMGSLAILAALLNRPGCWDCKSFMCSPCLCCFDWCDWSCHQRNI
jgi:hypothetical protein